MKQGKEVENPESRFFTVLLAAAKLPGVRIHREAYLRSALARHCSEDEIRRAIEETPAAAGITVELLDKVAKDSIRYETAKVSALSAAAGVPGILALPATVPADMAQYVGHMLRIAQKLAYLYSWPDLFSDEGDDVDDATKGVLTLFFGVMFGTQSANAAVGKVAGMMAEQVAKTLPKKALTHGVVYPMVKKVAGYLGVKMTTQSFATTVSKAIPLVGAAVSGGLTLATYLPMAKRLKKHLAGCPWRTRRTESWWWNPRMRTPPSSRNLATALPPTEPLPRRQRTRGPRSSPAARRSARPPEARAWHPVSPPPVAESGETEGNDSRVITAQVPAVGRARRRPPGKENPSRARRE